MIRWVVPIALLVAVVPTSHPLFPASASPPPPSIRDLGTAWVDGSNNVTYRLFGGAIPGGPPRRSFLVSPDPDLEPGFPVRTLHEGGTYHAGPAIHTLVGDIAGDSRLEIIVTGLAGGPLYAWHHDGTPVAGWPVGEGGVGYPAIGKLRSRTRSVFAGFWDGGLAAYGADGTYLSGWPIPSANYVETPATVVDVDTGRWEIFVEEEDWQLHGYRATGGVLPGWPVWALAGQERHTPAVADLDRDGDQEILTASTAVNGKVSVFAYHHDGSLVAGFPIQFNGYPDTYLAIGNVVGNHRPEIVVVSSGPAVHIYSAAGTAIRSIGIPGSISYGSAPALADLDGDGLAEIIVQSDGQLNIFRGDSRPYPGWPVRWSTQDWVGNSAPVVGDVDGDPEPEVVLTTHLGGQIENGEVRVYNRDGTLHPHFPKALKIGAGAVPAIADIDLDGRNEIVVCGAFWNGYSGMYDKCWAYDLGGGPHGPILWGQFGGNAAHQGRYPVP